MSLRTVICPAGWFAGPVSRSFRPKNADVPIWYSVQAPVGTPKDIIAKLNAEFRNMDSGALIRLVLDVERGALYYYVVHSESERFLIGVTLDQDMVHVTDRKLQVLVDDIRHHMGHPRITELEK